MTSTGHLLWKPALAGAHGPLYRAIVAALRSDIEQGRLHPGDRLPTQRSLAAALGLGLGTVTHAYKEAERQGLLSSRVGRGSFVASPTPSDPLGLPDTRLVEMSVDLPIHTEDPDLASALQKIARKDGVQRLLRYHDHAGTARHRQAGAVWAERFGMPAGPDDILVCAGSQHALTVALMCSTAAGDVVLCDELTYPGIRAIARQLQLSLESIPMDAGGMRPRAIEAACKRRRVRALYCVPSFHNPTTTQLDGDRRQAIARLAIKHDVVVLEDDVHRLMSETPAAPLSTLAPDHGFFVASFSKAVTGGLRVAFLVPPAAYVRRATDAIWATVFMVPTLTVEVAATWIEDGTADAVVAAKHAEAGRRQDILRRLLADAHYDAQPHGYYAWLHLPDPWTSADFAAEARRRGVAVTPSSAFFMGAGRPPPAVRVCLAAPETREQMTRGLETLRGLLDEQPSGW